LVEKLAIFENVLYYWMEGNKCVHLMSKGPEVMGKAHLSELKKKG
jgi:hypothetical protein